MTSPDYDLKALIRSEHQRAELQRLDNGLDGCGCSDCQDLYKTLDLSKYSNRVLGVGDFVLIKEKSQQNTPQTDASIAPDKQGAVTKIKGGKLLLPITNPATEGNKLQPEKPTTRRGRPAKHAGELVSRMTLYRRRQKKGGYCDNGNENKAG